MAIRGKSRYQNLAVGNGNIMQIGVGVLFLLLLLGQAYADTPTMLQALDNLKDTSQGIWKGEVGGYVIDWTTHDIEARNLQGSITFSIRQSLRHELEREASGLDWPYLRYGRSYQILSVVGGIVSVDDRLAYSNPGGYSTSRYRALSLDGQGQIITLTDIFKGDDVLKALLSDKIIKNLVVKIKIRSPLKKPDDLIVALVDGNQGHESDYLIDADWLSNFAFHHLQGDKVAVRLSLRYRDAMRSEAIKQIGLLLPIPPKLAADLKAADKLEHGFLMKDADGISKGLATRIEVNFPE